jgi:ubiquinone/menaquinone biosynthesis C-methylase UbiE
MDEQALLEWKKDSQSFDTVAGFYDKFRPTYPRKLVDSIIELSKLPAGARILEIGAGTGKATRLFAARGYTIHCIEPGANLVALAARKLKNFPRVSFENVRFEESQDQPDEFDLVMSAQAFHWVSKDIGFKKAFRAMKPGGYLALFWNMQQDFKGKIAEELDGIYRKVTPELHSGQEKDTEKTIQERVDDITASGCFGPVSVHRFSSVKSYSTSRYTGLLNMYSDHLRLSQQTLKDLLKAVAGVIDSNGGYFKIQYTTVLYLSQKPA